MFFICVDDALIVPLMFVSPVIWVTDFFVPPSSAKAKVFELLKETVPLVLNVVSDFIVVFSLKLMFPAVVVSVSDDSVTVPPKVVPPD